MASPTASSTWTLARSPQALIAYDMNGGPLPTAFGAPLRLRLENQLGYKMVKWIRSMELVADYQDISAGHGGWRADLLHYSRILPSEALWFLAANNSARPWAAASRPQFP